MVEIFIDLLVSYRLASLLDNNLALVSTMNKIKNPNSRQWRVYLASFLNMSAVQASLAKIMYYTVAHFPVAVAVSAVVSAVVLCAR